MKSVHDITMKMKYNSYFKIRISSIFQNKSECILRYQSLVVWASKNVMTENRLEIFQFSVLFVDQITYYLHFRKPLCSRIKVTRTFLVKLFQSEITRCSNWPFSVSRTRVVNLRNLFDDASSVIRFNDRSASLIRALSENIIYIFTN